MLGHYFLCVESKTVDKKSEEDQEIYYNSEISELPDPSKTEKHILTYSMPPELNLEVPQGRMLWQLQLSLSLCTQCLFICTCLYSLMLHSASSSCLSAFLFPSHQTQQPQPFTVYSLLPSGSPSPLVLPFSNLRPFTISLLV